jgi:hypothetical protein
MDVVLAKRVEGLKKTMGEGLAHVGTVSDADLGTETGGKGKKEKKKAPKEKKEKADKK